MKLNLYDDNLNRLAIVENFVSLLWTVNYNAVGSFTLEMVNSTLSAKFKPWYFLTSDFDDHVMIVTGIDSDDGTTTITGATAEYILNYRASDQVISNAKGETAIYGLIAKMDQWEHFSASTTTNTDNIVYNAQISDMQLLEYVENIAQGCDMGFKTVKDGKNLVFTCYKPPENANGKYSALYGNLSDEDYTSSDIDYYNVAIVAGAGEGANRVTVTTHNTYYYPTGKDRRELYVDARNEQPEENESREAYEKRLADYGKQQLVEHVKVESITFKINDDRCGLGDIVTAILQNPPVTIKARVKTIETKAQNNVVEKTISVGEPISLRNRR